MSNVLASTETKEKVVANLANFAYDLYNYTFLYQVYNSILIEVIGLETVN